MYTGAWHRPALGSPLPPLSPPLLAWVQQRTQQLVSTRSTRWPLLAVSPAQRSAPGTPVGGTASVQARGLSKAAPLRAAELQGLGDQRTSGQQQAASRLQARLIVARRSPPAAVRALWLSRPKLFWRSTLATAASAAASRWAGG